MTTQSGTGLLYVDAGGRTQGDIWIGVADETGVLLDADLMRDTLLNHAEMGAILLACDYIRFERGVILSDSLTAVKTMGRDRGLHKGAGRTDEFFALRDAVLRKLPAGWCVAWVPRERNRADAVLETRIREVEGLAP